MNRSKEVVDYTTADGDYIRLTRYPFQEVGPLKMHVPYHFVIVNSGGKLENIFPESQEIDFDTYFPWADPALKGRVAMLHKIYRIWMRSQPYFMPRSKPSKTGECV